MRGPRSCGPPEAARENEAPEQEAERAHDALNGVGVGALIDREAIIGVDVIQDDLVVDALDVVDGVEGDITDDVVEIRDALVLCAIVDVVAGQGRRRKWRSPVRGS